MRLVQYDYLVSLVHVVATHVVATLKIYSEETNARALVSSLYIFNIFHFWQWDGAGGCGDKTVLWLSYLHNGISYTSKMASLYWIRALLIFYYHGCHWLLMTLELNVPGHQLPWYWPASGISQFQCQKGQHKEYNFQSNYLLAIASLR